MECRNRHRAWLLSGVLLLVACRIAAAEPITLDAARICDGAPPVPKGYGSAKELDQAVKSGALKQVGTEPIAAPGTIIVEQDITYGKAGAIKLLLDLYRPKSPTKLAPGLIFVHDGGWRKKGKDRYAYWAIHYAALGYVCASIEFRTAEEAVFPGAIEDAQCAVRWMRANAGQYGITPAFIGIAGRSTGAQIALIAAYAPDVFEGEGWWHGVSSRVQAVMVSSAVADLTTPAVRDLDTVRGFLGGKFEDLSAKYVAASPIGYVTPDAPPTLIFHGTLDEAVPIRQVDLFAEKLKALGVPHIYERLEGWDHQTDTYVEVNRHCLYVQDRFLEAVFPPPK